MDDRSVTRIIVDSGIHYRVRRGPSIHPILRANCDDITIWRENPRKWGARFDGRFYCLAARIAAEDGGMLDEREPVPVAVSEVAHAMRIPV